MLLLRPHCLISFLYLDVPEDKQDYGYTACAGTCICMSYFLFYKFNHEIFDATLWSKCVPVMQYIIEILEFIFEIF